MEQLNTYIKQARQQGRTDEQIRQELLATGWDINQVDSALIGQPLTSLNAGTSAPVVREPLNRFGLIMLFVVIFGGSLLGLGGGLALKHHENKTKAPQAIPRNNQQSGTNASSTSMPVCTSESCFAPKFASCSPAILDTSAHVASVHYSISGKQGSGCKMLLEYTSNPNPAWVNQPLTCSFNNKKSLDAAVSDVFNDLLAKSNSYSCTGSLVAILQSQ